MTAIRLDSLVPRTHRIRDKRQLTPQVHSFRIEGTLAAKAGQFILAWVPGLEELPLSVVEDDGQFLTLAFFVVGQGTQALAAMQDGDLVGVRGPFGTHFDPGSARNVAVVGGGFGSAPMLNAGKAALAAGAALHVVLGAKSREMLLFREPFEALKPASFVIATDDGSEGHKGMLTEPLDALLAGGKIDLVMACGPDRMLSAVSDVCHARGVKAQLSVHRHIKCGYGLCGTCVVGRQGIRLCKEGPVISNDLYRSIDEVRTFKRDGLGVRHPF